MNSRPLAGYPRRHARQRGVVLFVALIVLVAMTMAGLALMRASGTGILAAGNLAFKQSATASGDAGIEAARVWLIGQTTPGALDTNRGAEGYYATWDTTFNPFTSTVWNGGAATVPGGQDAAGNTVKYVIHRMCATTGSLATVPTCVTVAGGSLGGSKGGIQYGERPLTGNTTAYYRVTAQIQGPKNTLSYVQTMLY